MTSENRLVLAYAYLMKFNGKMPDELPNGDTELLVGIPGYFVGSPEEPSRGNFEGRNNFRYALAKFFEKCHTTTFLDLGFEGLVKDEGITLLLQPLQKDPNKYKSVDELAQLYLPN